MAKGKKDKNTKGTAPAAGQKTAGTRSGGSYLITVLMMIVVLMAVFATPALIVFAVGMVPSMVAAIVDRHPGRNATIAVTAMNFAGVMPFVAEMLGAGATMGRATAMVGDVFTLAMMFGAAAFGWALVYIMPKVATVFISVRNDARIQSMVREKKRLVEEWGEDVTTPPPPKKRARAKTGTDTTQAV